MRSFIIVVFIANLALTLVSLIVLPAQVAIHFGLGGQPDHWASSLTNAVFFFVLQAGLFAIFFYLPVFIENIPPRLINLPNREYWFAPENQPRMRTIIANAFHGFGSVLLVFLAAAQLLGIRANLATPVRLNETALLIILGLFLLYTIYWCIRLIAAFRLPKTN